MLRLRTKDLFAAVGLCALVLVSGCLSLESGRGEIAEAPIAGSDLEPLIPLEPLDFSSPSATEPATDTPVVIPASPSSPPEPIVQSLEVKGEVLWGFPAGPGDIILVELRDGSRLLGQQELLTAPAANNVPFAFTSNSAGVEKCATSNSCRVVARMKRGSLVRASGQTRFRSGISLTVQIGMLGDVS